MCGESRWGAGKRAVCLFCRCLGREVERSRAVREGRIYRGAGAEVSTTCVRICLVTARLDS